MFSTGKLYLLSQREITKSCGKLQKLGGKLQKLGGKLQICGILQINPSKNVNQISTNHVIKIQLIFQYIKELVERLKTRL